MGCQHGPGGAGDPGLTPEETRSHFGAWCIVSSPLTLSHDVNNDTVMDQIWDVIANPEAIAVNQAWAGHSGSPFKSSGDRVSLVKMPDMSSKAQARREVTGVGVPLFRLTLAYALCHAPLCHAPLCHASCTLHLLSTPLKLPAHPHLSLTTALAPLPAFTALSA